MSYIKITQLPTATGVTDDDYLVIVDSPSGSPITRKVAFGDVVDSVLDDLDAVLIGGSGIFIDYNVGSGTFTINAYIDGGNI